MTKTAISEDTKSFLYQYLMENPFAELVGTYLLFIEKKFNIQPVLFVKEKVIYQSADEAVKKAEEEGQLWHETEIKIGLQDQDVNEQTQKIYICPFTGKVFGDNTHPNPQDAIYEWVSRCPENKERVGGLRVKRFLISEDPEVIKNYIPKGKPKEIIKVVYSSVLSGKLFNSKEAVVHDFKKNYLKSLTLEEVQNQNRFQIEEGFLNFIQSQLVEDKIASFVEALAEYEEFSAFVAKWIE